MSEFDSLFLSVCEGDAPTEALADWIAERMPVGDKWISVVKVGGEFAVELHVCHWVMGRYVNHLWIALTTPKRIFYRERDFGGVEHFLKEFPDWLRDTLLNNHITKVEVAQ